MELLWHELTNGIPDRTHLGIVLIRVLAATFLGSVIGIQRQRVGKPAGLRTHMLVSLGTAVVVVACEGAGIGPDGLSRVVQGVVTGIGFVGAGSILKLSEEREIKGLTTAVGVWLTAAIGVAVGLGTLGIAVIVTVLTLLVLTVMEAVDARVSPKK